MLPPAPAPAAVALVAAWAVAGMVWDARERRLPNALTLGGLAIALAYLLGTGRSLLGAPGSEALVCAALAAGLFGALWARGWVGAGDLKWMVAAALATTPLAWTTCWLAGSGLAALLAGAVLVAGRIGRRGTETSAWTRRANQWRSSGIPLGVPYGLGLIYALVSRVGAP